MQPLAGQYPSICLYFIRMLLSFQVSATVLLKHQSTFDGSVFCSLSCLSWEGLRKMRCQLFPEMLADIQFH